MKKSEAMPGSYLGKDDFEKPCACVVARVELEEVKDIESGAFKTKAVMYVSGPSTDIVVDRGIILNSGNWDSVEEISGEEDSDKWAGTAIEIYVDPNVMFGGKKTGGVRIRESEAPF